MLSIDVVKKQARDLKAFLNKNNSEISISSCYQAIAIINGYPNWNTMSAIMNNKSENDMSSDIAERIENFEILVHELTKELDNLKTKFDDIEPYILEQQGIDPYNFPD